MSRSSWLLVLASLLFLAHVPAQAQYPWQPGYPGAYPPGYYPGAVGGALQGSAAVTQAQGDLMVQREQAYILREKADQEKLVTKKQAFDQGAYERRNQYTQTEEEARIKDRILQRMLNTPTSAEITNGKALNILTPYLNTLSVQGVQGPPVPLDQNILKKISVTVPGSNSGVGMFKDGGKLQWPFVLHGPTQQKVAALLPDAIASASTGSLNARQFYDITKGVEDLNKELSMKFRKEEIDGAGYVSGKRFLESLENSVKALEKPQSQQMLNGTYAARGRTVPELVQNMTRQGLQFAPAAPGTDEAYYAVYYAYTAYAAGTQNNSGFRNQASPGAAGAP